MVTFQGVRNLLYNVFIFIFSKLKFYLETFFLVFKIKSFEKFNFSLNFSKSVSSNASAIGAPGDTIGEYLVVAADLAVDNNRDI